MGDNIFKITHKIKNLSDLCMESDIIDQDLYKKYDVKRGLRDINGKGVLAGLTNVSDVHAKDIIDGKEVPCPGKLYYRGYNVEDLVNGFRKDKRFGFEEVAYLLLFGELPSIDELKEFKDVLVERRTLPSNFVRDVIMKAPSKDMMNSLSRSVLTLYAYDENPDETSIANVLRQSLNLISEFPMLMVYSYQAYNHSINGGSLYIHSPASELSTSENILRMLRPNMKYTELEAAILDIALVLHMEHGGGNNSTFTTHVVTSSGTDTYSAMAAALCSLKGPKHGGANIKVVQMFDDLKNKIKDWTNEEEVSGYLRRILHKEEFDKKGLIYGMGHAVYSVSDPRANIFKSFVEKLAVEKGRTEEFELYSMVERLAPKIIGEERHIYKGVNANVDFYSGLVYSMLDLPIEMYTPMFATARIVGWSAHRIEELINTDKIIRPAYRPVLESGREYSYLENR